MCSAWEGETFVWANRDRGWGPGSRVAINANAQINKILEADLTPITLTLSQRHYDRRHTARGRCHIYARKHRLHYTPTRLIANVQIRLDVSLLLLYTRASSAHNLGSIFSHVSLSVACFVHVRCTLLHRADKVSARPSSCLTIFSASLTPSIRFA